MNIPNNALPGYLKDTSLEPVLMVMNRIYERIDEEQKKWTAVSTFRCPPGCGLCCETFEPDVLQGEALYLAAWLLENKPELIKTIDWSRPGTSCPLSNPVSEYHCTVYEGRPLICRLFAFSGDRAKDGTVRYRPCRHMDTEDHTVLNQDTLMQRFGRCPPVMGDLSAEVSMSMPEVSDERLPLREALQRALAKIRYLHDLHAFSVVSGEDGDNDNDNNPQPRAS